MPAYIDVQRGPRGTAESAVCRLLYSKRNRAQRFFTLRHCLRQTSSSGFRTQLLSAALGYQAGSEWVAAIRYVIADERCAAAFQFRIPLDGKTDSLFEGQHNVGIDPLHDVEKLSRFVDFTATSTALALPSGPWTIIPFFNILKASLEGVTLVEKRVVVLDGYRDHKGMVTLPL